MSWQDRIQEAVYTSSSSRRLVLTYEDVRKEFTKKGTAFEFRGDDNTYVQESGISSNRYPLRVFFSGPDYDIEANLFESILSEPGIGKLDHPIYGTINVVPFGRIIRRDDLKTAANQAIFEVVFWESIGVLYPQSNTNPSSEVISSVDDYNLAVSEEFGEVIDVDSVTSQVNFKNDYIELLDSAQEVLQPISDTQSDVEQQFNAIYMSINNGIDILVGQPVNLAFQTALLIQSPARALTSITARLNAYSDLSNSIITGSGAVVEPSLGDNSSNIFHTNNLYASSYVTGAILSSVNNEFITKSDALAAADAIIEQFSDVAAWQDANYEVLGEIDTGASYQQLQNAVAICTGFLVEISFSLEQERSIITDSPRTIIDLSAELYGDIEDKLSFLISTNNFSGSELLQVPRGREIVYYV